MNEWEKSLAKSFAEHMKDYSDLLLDTISNAINMEKQRRTEIAKDLFEKALGYKKGE